MLPLPALLVRAFERHPDGMAIVACTAADLAIVWTSRTLELPLHDLAWGKACRDALAGDQVVETELPLPSGRTRATLIPLDEVHVAVQLHERAGLETFDILFGQNVHGVFFMRLDEPFHWSRDPREQDAQLDYAFDHLRVVAVNDVVCRQTGQPRESILGTPPRQRWSAERARWRDHMRTLYDQGLTYHTVKMPRIDGTWLEVEGEYVCTYDEAGRLTGHCGIQRDITGKRVTVAELTNHRDLIDLAIAGADIGVWVANVAERQLYIDPPFMARLGYTDTAWRTWDWWTSSVHPDDVELTRRAFQAHLAGELPVMRAEYRLRKAGGGWVWVLSLGRAESGETNRVSGIFVDITERKALQERLSALGTLAAGIGHDINNPLTYIGLNLELIERKLRDHPGTDGIIELVERARYGAQRAGAIVNNLQALARAFA